MKKDKLNSKTIDRLFEQNKEFITQKLVESDVIENDSNKYQNAKQKVEDNVIKLRLNNPNLTYKQAFKKYLNKDEFKDSSTRYKENLIEAIRNQTDSKFNKKSFRKDVQGWINSLDMDNLEYIGDNQYRYTFEREYKDLTDVTRSYIIYQEMGPNGSLIWKWRAE